MSRGHDSAQSHTHKQKPRSKTIITTSTHYRKAAPSTLPPQYPSSHRPTGTPLTSNAQHAQHASPATNAPASAPRVARRRLQLGSTPPEDAAAVQGSAVQGLGVGAQGVGSNSQGVGCNSQGVGRGAQGQVQGGGSSLQGQLECEEPAVDMSAFDEEPLTMQVGEGVCMCAYAILKLTQVHIFASHTRHTHTRHTHTTHASTGGDQTNQRWLTSQGQPPPLSARHQSSRSRAREQTAVTVGSSDVASSTGSELRLGNA